MDNDTQETELSEVKSEGRVLAGICVAIVLCGLINFLVFWATSSSALATAAQLASSIMVLFLGVITYHVAEINRKLK